jgi:hypothetical protein
MIKVKRVITEKKSASRGASVDRSAVESKKAKLDLFNAKEVKDLNKAINTLQTELSRVAKKSDAAAQAALDEAKLAQNKFKQKEKYERLPKKEQVKKDEPKPEAPKPVEVPAPSVFASMVNKVKGLFS